MTTQVKLLKNLSLIVVAALVITLALPLSVIGEEVITLTTIMPGQDTLRVKRGAVGVDYKLTSTLSDAQIGDNNLLIEGNVGIGTTLPAGKLHVVDNEIPGNGFDDDGDGATDETDGIMVFTSEGNVGIGTTSPQNKLDVEGAVAIGATYSGTSSAPSNGMIIEGNVGIGTASPNSSKGSDGYLDAKDVYLRDTGKWASEGGVTVTAWDSGWFAISNNQTRNKAHGLGAKPDMMTVWEATSSSGANMCYIDSINAGSGNYGCFIYNITATGYTIKTYGGLGAVGEARNWQYARIVMMKVQ